MFRTTDGGGVDLAALKGRVVQRQDLISLIFRIPGNESHLWLFGSHEKKFVASKVLRKVNVAACISCFCNAQSGNTTACVQCQHSFLF
jgi:hypothetical protein